MVFTSDAHTADAHIESRLQPRIHTTDTFIETMPIHTRRPRKTIARRLLHAARDLVSLPLLVILAAMTSASVGADAASATFDAALCIDTTTVGGMATTCQAFAGGDAGKQVACCAALTAWNDAGCNCAILTGKTLLDDARVFELQVHARRYHRRLVQHHRRDGQHGAAVHPAVTASASVAAPDLAGAAPGASGQRNRRRG